MSTFGYLVCLVFALWVDPVSKATDRQGRIDPLAFCVDTLFLALPMCSFSLSVHCRWLVQFSNRNCCGGKGVHYAWQQTKHIVASPFFLFVLLRTCFKSACIVTSTTRTILDPARTVCQHRITKRLVSVNGKACK